MALPPNTPEWITEPHMPDTGTVVIDCDDCAVRGVGCQDCVVSVLLGIPETLLDDERKALEVLADAGMAPRLRLVPIHRYAERGGDSGAA
jgi:hypothetical protein